MTDKGPTMRIAVIGAGVSKRRWMHHMNVFLMYQAARRIGDPEDVA
jgi:predicted NAD/FAD-binding protein